MAKNLSSTGHSSKSDGEKKPSSSDDNRRQSMPASKFSLSAMFPKRHSTSSANLVKDRPPLVMEGGRQLSVKASKLLGVEPAPHPPQPQANSPTQRPMAQKYTSRRFRCIQSTVQKESFKTKKKLPMGYMQIRNANLNNSFASLTEGDDENALHLVLLEGLKKPHLCDVAMIGKDGVTIRAPSFLLCSHSRVIEDMLFSTGSDPEHFVDAQDTIIEGEEAESDTDGKKTVKIPFATQDAIQTALYFMASHELPQSRVGDSSEENLRTLTQVNVFAKFYRMTYLGDEVYRAIKVLVNKKRNLASAVFDECSESMTLAGMEDKFKRNELMSHVFDSIREKPVDFLIEGGLPFLSAGSIQKILCDQEIDVDEITMFYILFHWVREGPGEREDKLRVAKALVSNIQLTLLDTKYLNSRVRYCGFVDASAVNEAIKEIENHIANLSPEEQEHVLVTGAGAEAVNGIYVRMEEDIGLGDEEAVFIKEASEDEIGGDYGLYLWKDSWAISPCVDYSNVLYSRYADKKRGWDRLKPSADKWKVESGQSPAPACQWNAGVDESKGNANYVAPRLSVLISPGTATFDMKKMAGSIGDITDGDHDEGTKELSLDDMLNLPTDQDFEGGDYRDVRPRLLRSDPSFARKAKEARQSLLKKSL